MTTSDTAEHNDDLISSVVALDWTSTIGPGETFCRSNRLLQSCWMCGELGTHENNLWVRCTNRDCVLSSNPVPRSAWQQAGGDAEMCLKWAKRFWKTQGDLYAARDHGLDEHVGCRESFGN